MRIIPLWVIALVGVLWFALSGLFVVEETSTALVRRLGEFVPDAKATHQIKVYEPGLHFKWPGIDRVYVYNKQIRMTDFKSQRVSTEEKKYVLVTLYLLWKVVDFKQYDLSTQQEKQTEALLAQNVIRTLLGMFGSETIKDLVQDSNNALTAALKEHLQQRIGPQLGIQIVDVRIKQIDLPQEVSEAVFDRMSTERQQAAEKLRAEGKAAAEMIRAEADLKARRSLAEAGVNANVIRAAADAEVAHIYATSYSKSPELFSLLKAFETYKQSFRENDLLMLNPNAGFMSYFQGKGIVGMERRGP